LISDARSDDICQFPPSKKIKLNDKLDSPQSSTVRIIGSNFGTPLAGVPLHPHPH
jgi:hypothetical protein